MYYSYDGTAPLDTCLTLDASVTWSSYPSLSTARKRASGIVWDDDSIWVTGGRDSANTVLRSTETFNGVEFEAGPDMPEPYEFHCVVKVSESNAMVIGG